DAHWAAAQRLEPFNAIYPWRRAQIAGAMGSWARTEQLAAQAASLEPGFLSARLLRAEALVRLGRKSEARTELAEVLRARSSRGDIARGSGYERTVWRFEPREYDRVAALAGR
ncbi:MAG: tetratricopeptide repeat protein, partial [Elusimicrobiota bacterium]